MIDRPASEVNGMWQDFQLNLLRSVRFVRQQHGEHKHKHSSSSYCESCQSNCLIWSSTAVQTQWAATDVEQTTVFFTAIKYPNTVLEENKIDPWILMTGWRCFGRNSLKLNSEAADQTCHPHIIQRYTLINLGIHFPLMLANFLSHKSINPMMLPAPTASPTFGILHIGAEQTKYLPKHDISRKSELLALTFF